MRRVGAYDVEDLAKIQGRDEVSPKDRSLAGIRLRTALKALTNVSGNVLLLGCGAGRYVRAIHRERPDFTLFGGDLSLNALREARSADPETSYVALDASRLPWADARLAAVVFFDLLEHVPEHKAMLREIQRVLSPGGVLHFFVPLEGEPGTLYSWLKRSRLVPIHRWKRDHVGHVHQFDARSVLQTLWNAGLRVDDVSFGFHLIGQGHDVVDYWRRERSMGGTGILPVPVVNALTRAIFLLSWRLSYLEDRVYSGRMLASGLHVTASKPLAGDERSLRQVSFERQ